MAKRRMYGVDKHRGWVENAPAVSRGGAVRCTAPGAEGHTHSVGTGLMCWPLASLQPAPATLCCLARPRGPVGTGPVCGSCVRAHRSSPVPAASLCAAWPSRLLLCAEGSHALMRWSMRRRPPWSWRDHSAGCLHWSSPTALPSVCCLPAQNCIDRQRGARRRVGARVHPRQRYHVDPATRGR